jgi:hypothetical protein
LSTNSSKSRNEPTVENFTYILSEFLGKTSAKYVDEFNDPKKFQYCQAITAILRIRLWLASVWDLGASDSSSGLPLKGVDVLCASVAEGQR